MGGPPGAGAQGTSAIPARGRPPHTNHHGASRSGGAFNPKELVCGACSNTSGQTCLIHGEEYMEVGPTSRATPCVC